jgi:hypothetical protein
MSTEAHAVVPVAVPFGGARRGQKVADTDTSHEEQAKIWRAKPAKDAES